MPQGEDGTREQEASAHPVRFLHLFDVARDEGLVADLLDRPQGVPERYMRELMRLVAARPPRSVKRVVDDDAPAIGEAERALAFRNRELIAILAFKTQSGLINDVHAIGEPRLLAAVASQFAAPRRPPATRG
jgi:hypothetical protein